MKPISPNARAWLKALSAAEGTTRDGEIRYDIMFGGGRFTDLSRHPDTVIDGGRYKSAAAGAYQFMPGTWREAKADLKLKDFGPYSQDQAALYLMRRRGVDPDTAPINAESVALLSPEWASLPTLNGNSYYGQPVKSLEFIQEAAGAPVTFQQIDGTVPPLTQTTSLEPSEAEVQTTPDVKPSQTNVSNVLQALQLIGLVTNTGDGLSQVAKEGQKMLDTPTYSEDEGKTPRIGLDPTGLMNTYTRRMKNALLGSTQTARSAFTE